MCLLDDLQDSLEIPLQLQSGAKRLSTRAGNSGQRTGDVRLDAIGRQRRNDSLIVRDEASGGLDGISSAE
jgi:hypothetical protein